MTDSVQLLIDGEQAAPADGAYYDCCSPSTSQVAARVAAAGPADAERAVAAAQQAFPSWHRTPYSERRRVLLAAADHLEGAAQRIQASMAVETGATLAWSGMNVAEAAATLREAAGLTSAAIGDVLPAHDGDSTNLSLRVPAGVVLAIVPWNAPLVLAARSLAIALAVGNTVVVRPSEHAPVSAGHVLADALTAAGAPPGVINVVTTSPERAPEVIRALIAHPAVRRVVFIGSTPVGRKIAALAGEHLTPAVLELGGKNPTVVLEDADLDQAADTLLHAAFANTGQVCMATDRVIVARPVLDGLAGRLASRAAALRTGDPRDPATDLGPLINAGGAQRFRDLVSDALALGATALSGTGQTDGLLAEPVVLVGVPDGARLHHEEAFSPVVVLHAADDDADAVRQANDTDFGLIASVLSGDAAHAWRVAEQLHAGAVHVNGSSVGDEPHVPFGGLGLSGYGRLGGVESVRTFTEQRTLYLHGLRLGHAVTGPPATRGRSGA